MKLVLAIVNNDDSAVVASALTQEGFFVTKLSTTGGFLMVGNATLLIGTQDDKTGRIKEILKKYEEDMNIDDLDEDGKNTEKFDGIDAFAKHESIVKDAKANADSNKNSEKKYTLNDFKDDYFNKHLDISEIVDKLSEEDKNKILSILLSKNTIEESDFE